VNVENPSFEGKDLEVGRPHWAVYQDRLLDIELGMLGIKLIIVLAVEPVASQWSQLTITPASQYGMRGYNPNRILIKVWRFSFDHFDGHDSQAPDIDFGPVGFLGDYLRSHPIWCPDHSCSPRSGVVDLSTEAKVS